ncbi:hypothetical protein [Nosocomiicoccus ampullae]|uniref:hypothetical protein n=1 Tax=Nosocomiicoccus ampullae TaxID=489910 RepID=UPI001C5D1247|nr:hypothetical protein [Nosocomiicoccus ampullae]QYA47974.1 hypothetical protein KPF52_05825 [Nosocomiicoccus ampullae]
MQKDRDVEAQSFVILILMCFVYMFANELFNWNSDFIDFLIFFIAWRVMTIEGTLFKN